MKVMTQLRNSSRLVTAMLGLAFGLSLSATASAETVNCKEKNGLTSYMLVVDWKAEKATIQQRYGTGQWKKLYEGATVVRNSPQDPAMLAEGTPREWRGGFDGKCGAFIDTLFFDVENQGGKLGGKVERTARWVQDPAHKGKCNAGVPAPDLASTYTEITCAK